MEKFKILVLIRSGLVALILLLFTFPTSAQNNGQVPENNNTAIDTVDDQNDLFDDNTNYKDMYKDLNKDGEWLQMKQSDLDADDENAVNNDDNVTTVKIINVWRPYGMGSDWSPYGEGRWVYTYSGWIWSTDYDWGWAAYHYGRWVYYDLYGWVWMPGRYWAPSWVQWCYTSNYIGWYPLYPRWYGWHRHGHYGWHDRYYHGGHHNNWVIVNRNKFTEKINKNVAVDRNKNSEILNGSKTKAIVKYDGNSFVNVGPKVTAIEKNTGQKITPKEINYNGSKGVTKIDNNSVNIYRNDLSKKEKVNSQNGSKNNTSVNRSKQNNGSKNNNNNGTKYNNNNGTKHNNNNGTKYNGNNGNKENVNRGSKGNNGYNNNRGNEGNHGSKGNSGYNTNKGNNGNHETRSNNGNNGSRSNSNNNSRGSDSSRSNNGSRNNR